jgi:glycosyltransferase involved in cell wall biosynthesis
MVEREQTMADSGIPRTATGTAELATGQPTNPSQISVTLGVGLASYQRTLPEALLRAGMLRRLFRFGIDVDVFDPNGNNSLELVRRFGLYRSANGVLWGVWRRLPGTRRRRLPMVATCWLADRLTAAYTPESRVFHSWTAVSLASLQVGKRRKAVTLIENPMLHPRHWQREVLAECNRFGIRPENCDAVLPGPLVDRREREFEMCDRIIVPSEAARQSFVECGCGSKATVVWPGVDHHVFRPPQAERNSPVFRACYVGRVELAKGLFYLLEAWKRLRLPHSELVLVGEIRPEVQSILRDCSSHNIRLAGLVPPDRVAQYYQQSSLFLFPSVNEGLALVLLEAMACGLAVVATAQSGAKECVTEGKEGFVVPGRDVDALAEAILWCYHRPDELARMGKAARRKVENQFTLKHYVERQIATYRALAT